VSLAEYPRRLIPWRDIASRHGLPRFERTVGLIYADSNSPATLHFSGEELGLLKTLRNQAVLAMRQHS
jgi:hypothetical protein